MIRFRIRVHICIHSLNHAVPNWLASNILANIHHSLQSTKRKTKNELNSLHPMITDTCIHRTKISGNWLARTPLSVCRRSGLISPSAVHSRPISKSVLRTPQRAYTTLKSQKTRAQMLGTPFMDSDCQPRLLLRVFISTMIRKSWSGDLSEVKLNYFNYSISSPVPGHCSRCRFSR